VPSGRKPDQRATKAIINENREQATSGVACSLSLSHLVYFWWLHQEHHGMGKV
jgi:hypothetical protein